MSLLCIGLTWHRAVESGGAPFSSLSASEFARRLRRAFARGTSLRDAPFTPVATAHGPVARGRRDPGDMSVGGAAFRLFEARIGRSESSQSPPRAHLLGDPPVVTARSRRSSG